MKQTLVSLLFILQIAVFAGPGQTSPSALAEACPRDISPGLLAAGGNASNVYPQASQEPPVELRVLVGKSLVLNSRETLRRVSVADPSIVSAVSISPTQVMLNGAAAGKTTLILWNEQERSTAYEQVPIGRRDLRQQHVGGHVDRLRAIGIWTDLVRREHEA